MELWKKVQNLVIIGISKLSNDELETIKTLYLDSQYRMLKKENSLLADSITREHLAHFFSELVQVKDLKLFAWFKKGKIVAFCLVQPMGGKLWKVNSVTVSEDNQYHGIGTNLLQQVLSWAKANSYTLFGWVHKSFTNAISFYRVSMLNI